MRIKQFIRILAITAMLMIPVLTHAQDPDPNAPPDGGDDPGAPIDGGLGLLLAAGAAYGIKKYRDSRKKKEEETDGLK